jgi:hypothetical protein
MGNALAAPNPAKNERRDQLRVNILSNIKSLSS